MDPNGSLTRGAVRHRGSRETFSRTRRGFRFDAYLGRMSSEESTRHQMRSSRNFLNRNIIFLLSQSPRSASLNQCDEKLSSAGSDYYSKMLLEHVEASIPLETELARLRFHLIETPDKTADELIGVNNHERNRSSTWNLFQDCEEKKTREKTQSVTIRAFVIRSENAYTRTRELRRRPRKTPPVQA